jgi:hypothetical protein
MSTRTALTNNEARRAIYIDFEGAEVDPASFLGVAIEGEWHVYVVEEALRDACEQGTRGGVCETTTLAEALWLIRSIAETEDRQVVAYSTREIDEITSSLEAATDELAWWQANLVNAAPIARRWARRSNVTLPRRRPRKGERVTKWPLAGFMAAVGYEVPKHLGPGNSAARIREVRRQLEKRGSYQALTSVAKGKWTKALDHNRHDCLGLATVMSAVTADA